MLGREYAREPACEVALIDLLLGLLGTPLRKPLPVDLGLNGADAEELRLDLLLGFISFAIFTIFWKSALGRSLMAP